MDEFALIRLLNGSRGAIFPPEAGVRVGIGDDAAVVAPSAGTELVVSVDTMVENVHFSRVTMRWADIGYKAMASSLSDLAAMGARPRWALVALSAPKGCPTDSLSKLYEGLYACAGKYGAAVIGGDTTSSLGGMVVTVTVIGEADAGKSLLRSGARAGDAVFVTGPLGGSAAGLHYLLQRGKDAEQEEAAGGIPERLAPLVTAHRRPEPRIAAGRLLAGSGFCGALNDVSDGLASEAWEIAEASGAVIVLDEQAIPVTEQVRAYAAEAGIDPLEWALFGGEDYELTGTVPKEHAGEMAALFQAHGLPFQIVGQVAERGSAPDVLLRKPGGELVPVVKRGYNHFS